MSEIIIAQFENLPYGYVRNFMQSQLERLCSTTEFSLREHRCLDNSWSHDDIKHAPTKINQAIGLYHDYYNGDNSFEIKLYDLESSGSAKYKSGLYVHSSRLSLKGETLKFVKRTIDNLREKDSMVSLDKTLNDLGFR